MMRYILLLCCVFSLSVNAQFNQVKAKGFHWYTKEQDKKKVEPIKPEPKSPQAKPAIEPYEELMQSRKNTKNVLAEALLRPSFESTRDYMAAQQKLAKRHQEFVRYWEQVLLVHPELDHTLNSPVNNSAIGVKNDSMSILMKKIIGEGAKKYGLILFYKGNSLISQKFMSSLLPFVEVNHFSMISVSTDGKQIEGVPNPKLIPLLEVQKKLNIQSRYMPALFLVNLKSNKMQPLSYGFISITQLKERFLDLATNFKRFSYQGLGEKV